jgi:hypothetical protein
MSKSSFLSNNNKRELIACRTRSSVSSNMVHYSKVVVTQIAESD